MKDKVLKLFFAVLILKGLSYLSIRFSTGNKKTSSFMFV